MREHVKLEVAFEIISMCLALAIQEKDIEEIKKIEELKRKLYHGDLQTIEVVINDYGQKVKKSLEVRKND